MVTFNSCLINNACSCEKYLLFSVTECHRAGVMGLVQQGSTGGHGAEASSSQHTNPTEMFIFEVLKEWLCLVDIYPKLLPAH